MILSWNILPLWKDKFFLQQKKRRHQWTFFFFCLSPWNLLLYQIWLFCRHRLIYNNDLVRSSRDWKVQLSFFHISSYRKYSTGKIVVILKSVSDDESRYFCSFRHTSLWGLFMSDFFHKYSRTFSVYVGICRTGGILWTFGRGMPEYFVLIS